MYSHYFLKEQRLHHCTGKQFGNVLLLSLALLVVVSLLGLSSMRGALSEEQVSINIQDHHLATEAAESALRAGERALISSSVLVNNPGYYSYLDGTTPELYTWTDSNSYKILNSVWGINNLQPVPRYKIELFAAIDRLENLGAGMTEAEALAASTKFYRIIGYGQGRSENAIVLEESIVIHQ
jgi:type IV pilus assembly protein PilX